MDAEESISKSEKEKQSKLEKIAQTAIFAIPVIGDYSIIKNYKKEFPDEDDFEIQLRYTTATILLKYCFYASVWTGYEVCKTLYKIFSNG